MVPVDLAACLCAKGAVPERPCRTYQHPLFSPCLWAQLLLPARPARPSPRLQIDQSTDPTRVTIAGSPQSLQLAVSMVNDIVRGTFKGFAMLRQIALSSSQPGMPGFGQPQPVYVQGYGFVPPSQVCAGCLGRRGWGRLARGWLAGMGLVEPAEFSWMVSWLKLQPCVALGATDGCADGHHVEPSAGEPAWCHLAPAVVAPCTCTRRS